MLLWPNKEHDVEIEFYKAVNCKTDACVVIFAGGGYGGRAEHEGRGYAEFFQLNGINSFVVEYRVSPNRFPIELLDARRAVRYVRYHCKDFNINPDKIAVMGSSAGGHLAAMVSTYKKSIPGENVDVIDETDFLPNAQILCYPVILNPSTGYSHEGSYKNLLGDNFDSMMKDVDPALNADNNTPMAFIWHTHFDDCVNVINSYDYAKALRLANVPCEIHVFPDGRHGLGRAQDYPHVAQWTDLLLEWLKYNNWL